MTSETHTKLDQTSRRTIGRFVLKCAISLIAAHLLPGERSYVAAAATWLSYYAVFTLVGALLAKDAVTARSFNYWDEAMWLLLAALLMYKSSHAVA